MSNLITVKQDAAVFSLLHFCKQLYMFRVLTPIIRSCLQKCNKLNTVASCWTVIQVDSRCTYPCIQNSPCLSVCTPNFKNYSLYTHSNYGYNQITRTKPYMEVHTFFRKFCALSIHSNKKLFQQEVRKDRYKLLFSTPFSS